MQFEITEAKTLAYQSYKKSAAAAARLAEEDATNAGAIHERQARQIVSSSRTEIVPALYDRTLFSSV